ncbi:MAG: hypothetical protein R3C39_14075 [Dehalococcoidia bacterium]
MPTVITRPPNHLVLLRDRDGAECPTFERGSAIAGTPACIAIGTLVDADGPTTVHLIEADGADAPPADLTLGYTGALRVPSRELVVTNVSLETLAALPVRAAEVTVEVWTNHVSEPDEILIKVRAT